MFKVVKRDSAELVGIVNEPRYIVRDPVSGLFFQAYSAENADGISVEGVPYNIGSQEKIPGAEFVGLVEIDNGEYHFQTHQEVVKTTASVSEMQGLILEQDNAISIMEEVLMEMDNQG